MSITIDWWIVPLIITIAAFARAAIQTHGNKGRYIDIAALLFYPLATVVSLVAWLFWSLFR